MTGKRKWLSRILFLIGFIICCYPLISSIIEQQYQKGAVATYEKEMQKEDDSKIKESLKKAEEYNSMLYQSDGMSVGDLGDNILSHKSYESLLDLSGTGVMGSIEIPKINVNLPIYHGTDDSVLSTAAGHVESSSLPVGGENTRTVITGHRGLPNSKLFTRLDEMKEGDLFFINVLGETLAYQVTEIEVIDPDDVKKLDIVPKKDLATLLTCTPYGLNTHRLLVTGERVTYEKEVHDSIEKETMSARELFFAVLPFIFLAIKLVPVVVSRIKRKRKEEIKQNEVKQD